MVGMVVRANADVSEQMPVRVEPARGPYTVAGRDG